jgi:formylglycine-generating enzyme required for sulfatase activity/class 3 adenylate cyclase
MGEIRNLKPGDPSGSSNGGVLRRLAAIIVADIASYSRLMHQDEEGTHDRMRRIQRELVEPCISEHDGRLVKTTGDGFIAMFDSPVEAVRCAIVIQQSLLGRNLPLPKQSRIEYRIGVNLGDVIVEPDDIYGDGVNIAARIEGLTDPGHVFISGAIYEQIKHKLVCGYEALGARNVKNITDPVTIYRVLPDAEAVAGARKGRETLLIALLSLSLLISSSGVLWYLTRPSDHPVDQRASVPPPVSVPPSAPPGVTAQGPAARSAEPNATTPQPLATPSPVPLPTVQTPKPVAEPAGPKPGPTPPFREPELVAVRGGTFVMGSNEDPTEQPVHQVSIAPLMMGKYPVTVREWNACSSAKACAVVATGADDAPVSNVSWKDARQYVGWLATVTGKRYRLPTEAEWEYAARAGTQTRFWWGDRMQPGKAACKDCGQSTLDAPIAVGAFGQNRFGLYDMGGTIGQWVEDCWHKNYQGAPLDGSAWTSAECTAHVVRSGSWKNNASYVRPSNRDSYDANVRYPTHGMRVALSP